MKYTINDFLNLIKNTSAEEELADIITRIILETESNEELVQEALDRVNSKLDWSSAIESTLYMSELN